MNAPIGSAISSAAPLVAKKIIKTKMAISTNTMMQPTTAQMMANRRLLLLERFQNSLEQHLHRRHWLLQ